MTTADVSTPPSAGAVAFLGNEGAYWRLRIKGAALVVLTLGLYRFWFATDVRRFLWSNTEIGGETLEYTGLATELLGGFLLAIAVLVPLYTAFSVAALEFSPHALVSAAIGLVLLALGAEFSLYRARRYRLTRTVFRGLRFDQHGSAWRYAFCALAWWAAVALSLGLAYPWAQASLQRFKMRHTSYGDLSGSFAGSGLDLFLRGVPIWLVVVGPIVSAFVALSVMVDWNSLNGMMDDGENNPVALLVGSAGTRVFLMATTALGISIIAAVLLYPLFQAIALRWWISGLRFGELKVTSQLRIGQVYRVYLRFVLYILQLTLLTLVAAFASLFAIASLVGSRHDSALAKLLATMITVGLYVVVALGASTIHQVVVTYSLWRLGAQSAGLAGAETLDGVRASGGPSSALGEGLADALGVGGI
jgi:uncharacterized membrane protein YjgN (DUF898 family)